MRWFDRAHLRNCAGVMRTTFRGKSAIRGSYSFLRNMYLRYKVAERTLDSSSTGGFVVCGRFRSAWGKSDASQFSRAFSESTVRSEKNRKKFLQFH